MPERSPREILENYMQVLTTADYDRFPEFLHADAVYEYPQSGERIRGIANIRAIFENYPGAEGAVTAGAERARIVGDDERWMMTPSFQVVRISGADRQYTMVVRSKYPDSSEWYIVSIVELREGKIAKSTTYFAPVFEAPEWRRPYIEALEASS